MSLSTLRRWGVLFVLALALAGCAGEAPSSIGMASLSTPLHSNSLSKPVSTDSALTPTAVHAAPTAATSSRPLHKGEFGQPIGIAVAANHRLLAVTTRVGVALVELPSMRVVRFDAIPGGGDEVAFSLDSTLMAVSISSTSPGTTQLRRVADGAVLASVDGVGPQFSRDGQTLATDMSDDNDAVAVLWNASDGARIGSISGEFATFSPDGQFVAMVHVERATQRPFTQLWRIDDGEKIARVDGADPIFSPNGLLLATTTEKDVQLWDIATSRSLHTLASDSNNSPLVTFSADGKQLFVVAGYDLQMWNVVDGSRTSSAKNAALWSQPRDVDGPRVFGPAGATLAVFAPPSEGEISGMRLVRTSDGKELFKDDAASEIAFTPDGALAATVSLNGNVQVICTSDGSTSTLDLR